MMAILTGMRRSDLFVVAVQSLSYIWLFATPWTIAHQTPLSSTVCWSLLKFTSIELVMLSKNLILCRPLLLLPWIFPSIKVFSSEPALCIRWSKYWSLSFITSPSNLVFTKCPFSVPGFHPGYLVTFTCYSPLGSSWLCHLLRTYLVFGDLDSFEENWSSILWDVSQLLCLMFFSWLGRDYGLTREVSYHFLSHHFKSTYYQHNLSLLMLTLITWLR